MAASIPQGPKKSRFQLFYLSVVFLLGIVIGSLLVLPAWGWLTVVGVGVILWRYRRKKNSFSWLNNLPVSLSILLVAFSFGGLRYQFAQPTIDTTRIAYYNDGIGSIALTGIIISPPDVRERYVQAEIQTESFYAFEDYQEIPAAGRVLVRLPLEGDWRYGDRIEVFGLLQTPPEDELFSYREYLARKGVFSYMPYATAEIIERDEGNAFLSLIFSFREASLDKIYQLWPDPEASLLAGILLGVESGIPDDVEAAFLNTGTSHIIAISGFNFTIIAGLVVTFFSKWLGRRRGAILAVVVIATYAILVGASAAVVRAALMGGLGLFARQVGRRQDGLTSLGFVAVLMAIWNPFVLWDVGFQLSYAAVLGLLLFVDPMIDWFEGLLPEALAPSTVRQISSSVGEYFLFTIAAQITTLPIIIYHFQRLSIVSLPANLVILPAQPPVMIVGGLAVLLSFVFQPLGQLVAYFAWPFVAYTIRLVELFDRVPGGNLVVGEPELWQVALFYVLLFGAVWRWSDVREKLVDIWKPTMIFVSLFVLTVLAWRSALHAPDGLLHVTLLEVDHGVPGSVLLQTPDGRYLLINGGGSIRDISDALGRRIPIGQRQLDWLVLTEADDDWALSNLVPRFPPQSVLWVVDDVPDTMAGALETFFVDGGIDVLPAQPGYTLDLGQGITLEVVALQPGGGNLVLRWRNFQLYLPAGASVELTGYTLPVVKQQDFLELTTDGVHIWAQAGR